MVTFDGFKKLLESDMAVVVTNNCTKIKARPIVVGTTLCAVTVTEWRADRILSTAQFSKTTSGNAFCVSAYEYFRKLA